MRISEKIKRTSHSKRSLHLAPLYFSSSGQSSCSETTREEKGSNMSNVSLSPVSPSSNQATEKFVMKYPDEHLENLPFDVKHEFERLRKELIEAFYQTACSRTALIIKRKVFRWYFWCVQRSLSGFSSVFWPMRSATTIASNENPTCWQLRNSIDLLPWTTTMNSRVQVLTCLLRRVPFVRFQDLLDTFRHSCMTCPLNFLSIDDSTIKTSSSSSSSSWSRVYVCDICHCTRALEDNMIRHLQTELHLSATEYLTDSVTMTLHHCVRRSCVQMNRNAPRIVDSIIVSTRTTFSEVQTISLKERLGFSGLSWPSEGCRLENCLFSLYC